MIPSIYINLEDDVSKVVARIKKERLSELILVCPKRCFLFNDSINLRLLKKQTDPLGKKLYILTMDEKGQTFAKEAGFELKYLPKASGAKGFSDIQARSKVLRQAAKEKASSVLEEKDAKKPRSIRPPAVISPNTLKKEQVKEKTENFFPKELEEAYKAKKTKQKTSRLLAAFLGLVLVIAALVVFVILPRAEINIYPKSQAITRDLVISVSTQVKEANTEGLLLPATKINQAVSAQSNFQSQGKKEVGNKASGSVVIYNFTGSTINLRAKTTLLVLNGRNYVLKTDALQIRATKYKNAQTKEVDTNSLTAPIEVESFEGGEGYNVPAGTRLELTNEVFGSNPQTLYAKAATAITGGTSRYLSFVSQEDINAAKANLEKQIFEDINNQLKEKGLAAPAKALELQSPQFNFDREAGTQSPEFNGQASGQAAGLAYNQQALEKMVLDRIKTSLAAENKIDIRLNLPLVINIKSIDLANELMVLDVHFDGFAIAEVKDIENLPKKLTAKSQAGAAEYVRTTQAVEKVEVTLFPGWQKSLPWLGSSIKIYIK